MKIASIIPGSGGSFYCENCMRDSTLAGAFSGDEFEIVQIPLYLPLFRHDRAASNSAPIFYGAVALYLRQRFPILRRLNRAVDRFLNSRPALALASRMAGSTRAAGLEEMTISMLLGEKGNQADELERLVAWLKNDVKPDIVHLSNALLLGLAGRLKEKLMVKVVCSLQDEHTWIEPMRETFRAQAWKLLREKARFVDRFIAVSNYYREEMARMLDLAPGRIDVVWLGVDVDRYPCRRLPPARPVIGFLSRIEEQSGLESLIEALSLLRSEHGLDDVRLVVYGGMTGDDVRYVKRIKKLIRHLRLESQVSLITSYDRNRRFDILHRLSVLCVPRRQPEAFGMFLLESLASGVPVVEPANGAFPEIMAETGGGLLYPQGDTAALARALSRILSDSEYAQGLAAAGCAKVRERFSIGKAAEKIGAIYRSLP
jgi:glycosyltransferase involved in cell wall biosynthesis